MEPQELRELADVKEILNTLGRLQVTWIVCDGEELSLRLDSVDRMVHIKARVGDGTMGDPALAIQINDFATSPSKITSLRWGTSGG